jgi:hypothetical protein
VSSKKPSRREFKPRRDRYARARGGPSHLVDVYCAACGAHVLLYQKDGPGTLVRLYLDRILAPPSLADLQYRCESKADVPNLVCPSCECVLGVPMLYAAEKRLAFRLIRGRFSRKKSPGVYPPEGRSPGGE